jgi:uncharacterized RDD family membrane protein YckC
MQSPVNIRARFWRRTLALLIDAVLVMTFVAFVGLFLFAPTGGRMRVESFPLVDFTACKIYRPSDPPAGIELPPGFKMTNFSVCAKHVFGTLHDLFLRLTERSQSGTFVMVRTLDIPIDATGAPTTPFYVDYFGILVLAVYLVLCEWRFGSALGKRLLGLRIRSLDGNALTFNQASTRILVGMIPVYPSLIVMFLQAAAGPIFLYTYFWYFIALAILSGICFLVGLVSFIKSVRKSDLPWHDRAPETEVVRTKRK